MAELDEHALTAAHLAVEDALIDFRDSRIGILGCANGFVVNERDGTPSSIMRLGTREGLSIGIKAYLDGLTVLDELRTATDAAEVRAALLAAAQRAEAGT
jgi:hypothetical protein